MNKQRFIFVYFFAAFALVQLACNAQGGIATPNSFATLDGIYTASALTAQSANPQQSAATATLSQPTLTSVPIPTYAINASPLPAPTTKCDAAEFVRDVTYADGSVVKRGETFVKTWRVKNVGTCSWTTAYALAFTGGDLMNGPLLAALPRNVNPGETIDLQVSFVAPNKDGEYRSYWKLRNASGAFFGVGSQADTAIWADVRVTGTAYAAYQFAQKYCEADWGNESAALPCPGSRGDAQGFVVKVDAPVMENGKTEDESALLVSPQDMRGGVIVGTYPAFTVQAGDHFRAVIGCGYESKKCDVTFRLDYKKDGKTKTLGTWHEIHEGMNYPVELDLSDLAGQTVKFILAVDANGSSNEDKAIWLNPHIARQGVPPPTATFTLTPTKTLTLTPSSTPISPTPTETSTP